MGFSLLDIRTGQRTTFATKDLLAILGDSINDEITIDGTVYRLSSSTEVIEVDASNLQTSFSWQNETIEIEEDAQSAFINPIPGVDTNSVFLTVNNVLYTHGVEADYHIQDDRIYWHGAFDLETTDRMQLRAMQVEISQEPNNTNPDTIAENE